VPTIPLHIDHLLRANGIELDDLKREQLGSFVSLLREWNQRINLVSRRDADNIWEGHIAHSLSPLFVLEIPSGASILDLGSGGGLPGIPMAIVHGNLDMTLLDSIQKKTLAVQEIVGKLGLSSTRVVNGRAEVLGKTPELAGRFDAVIARAVAPLVDLVRWALPFLRKRPCAPTGLKARSREEKSEFSFPYLLALKGGDLEREIRAAALRGKGATITELDLRFPGSASLNLTDKKLIVVEYP